MRDTRGLRLEIDGHAASLATDPNDRDGALVATLPDPQRPPGSATLVLARDGHPRVVVLALDQARVKRLFDGGVL